MRAASDTKQSLAIFVSYSRQDAKWLTVLEKMLKPLTRSGELLLWTDEKIKAGSRWRDEIAKAIDRSDAAILLVSSDFLASDFIAQHELPPLLERGRKHGLPVLWISVSSSLYEATEIAQYQSLNDPKRPLDTLPRPKARQQLVAIAERVRKVLESAPQKPPKGLHAGANEQAPVGSSRGDDAARNNANSRILGGDTKTIALITDCLARRAPEFAEPFDRAYHAAEIAGVTADRAEVIARQTRLLLAKKLSNARSGHIRKRIITTRTDVPEEIGEVGMVVWDSGDEYAGQVRDKQETGLGVYKIYSATRDFDPNAINLFEGDIHAGHFGPYGVYTFANSTVFVGEWVDGRPKLGMETFVHGKFPYEVYFGAIGINLRDGFQQWLPHGYGVAVSLRRKKAICDRFSYGWPSSPDNELPLDKPKRKK